MHIHVMHHALPRGIVVTRGSALCSAISRSLEYNRRVTALRMRTVLTRGTVRYSV